MYKTEVIVKEIELPKLLEQYCFPEKFLPLCKKCPDYGKVWSCPPGLPKNDEIFSKYKKAFVVGLKVIYDEDTIAQASSLEKADMIRQNTYKKAKRALLEILLVLEEQNPGSTSLGAGKCEVCSACSRAETKPCRIPGHMRYSFTAFGFDITAIAEELLGVNLLWEPNGLPSYDFAVAALLTE